MKKPDINTDAYRLVGEALFRIRQLLRDGLRAIYDEQWENGIPEERLGFLRQRRSHEASINWHLLDTSDVIDYAGFADLFEVVEANPQLQNLFTSLASDVSVLRIRFMELDTILNRIAYVREVADTEMSFLVSFEERLRKDFTVQTGNLSGRAYYDMNLNGAFDERGEFQIAVAADAR